MIAIAAEEVETGSLLHHAADGRLLSVPDLDRQERGNGALSAAEEVRAEFGIPVLAIAGLSELLTLASQDSTLIQHHDALLDYRNRYGTGQSAG